MAKVWFSCIMCACALMLLSLKDGINNSSKIDLIGSTILTSHQIKRIFFPLIIKIEIDGIHSLCVPSPLQILNHVQVIVPILQVAEC